MNDYAINSISRFKIRGVRPTTEPHKPCPHCYADATSTDAGHLIEYRCPSGHTFTGFRSDGLNHHVWLTRYVTSTEANR